MRAVGGTRVDGVGPAVPGADPRRGAGHRRAVAPASHRWTWAPHDRGRRLRRGGTPPCGRSAMPGRPARPGAPGTPLEGPVGDQAHRPASRPSRGVEDAGCGEGEGPTPIFVAGPWTGGHDPPVAGDGDREGAGSWPPCGLGAGKGPSGMAWPSCAPGGWGASAPGRSPWPRPERVARPGALELGWGAVGAEAGPRPAHLRLRGLRHAARRRWGPGRPCPGHRQRPPVPSSASRPGLQATHAIIWYYHTSRCCLRRPRRFR